MLRGQLAHTAELPMGFRIAGIFADSLFCYADRHDKAYDWAERRKLEMYPRTGAVQIIEIRETVKAAERIGERERQAEEAHGRRAPGYLGPKWRLRSQVGCRSHRHLTVALAVARQAVNAKAPRHAGLLESGFANA